MKYFAFIVVNVLIPGVFATCIASDQTNSPMGIGGFFLGEDIEVYNNAISANIYKDCEEPYLDRIEISSLPYGYRGGTLFVGNCRKTQKVLRIKLKYALSDTDFFDRLKKFIEKTYGPPEEYKGDPFQVFIAWKWRFEDKKGNIISMILQHYKGDAENYASGNILKLSFVSEIEKERRCYEALQNKVEAPSLSDSSKFSPSDMEKYIPQRK